MWQDWLFVVSLLASLGLVQGHWLSSSTGSTGLPVDTRDRSHLGGQHVDTVSSGRLPRSLNASWTAGYDWNRVVDTIFTIAQREILGQGKDNVSLPDAEKNFKHKFGFLTVRGEFHAWEGSLNNVAHIRRAGDVSVLKKGDNVWEMQCVVTVDDLTLRYERYELKALGLTVRGRLEGTVDSNTVDVTVHFTRTEEGCTSTLQGVKLTDLRGLKVHITGLGEFNGVGSAVATWIVEQREKDIASSVDRVLKREIERALEEFQCDEYISLLQL